MKKIIRFLLILLLIILLLVIYARYEGTNGLITKEYKIETADISNSFDGIKIVHFSDLHYKRIINKDRTKEIVDEINLINPDIVIFTGDLIDKDFDVSDEDIEDLTLLLNNINSKYGKYAIIGNHDYVRDDDILNDIYNNSSFVLLKNSYDIIYGDNNDKLFIGGVDTYSYDKADIDKTMEYFEDNEDIDYKIILVHEPDYIDTITSKYNVNLVLAGHSHNGQVRLPIIGPIITPDNAKKYYEPYYKIDKTKLYISGGIGNSVVNFRLFDKPSFNLYRLVDK